MKSGARTQLLGGAADNLFMAQAAAMRAVDSAAILEVDHEVTFDNGEREMVHARTYVELDETDGKLAHIKFFSTKPKRKAFMPTWLLHEEPKLAHREEEDPALATPPMALDYARFSAPLWNGKPKIDDLKQGIIGDCYLLSALGAVVLSDASVIMKMFWPTTPNASQYTVTLYRKGRGGTLQAHAVTIDALLPAAAATFDEAKNKRGHGQSHLAYADEADKHRPVLWPALIEKAYAQLSSHSYDNIGHGDSPATAIQTITGVSAQDDALPKTDDETYALLKNLIGAYAMAASSNTFNMHRGAKPTIQLAGAQLEAVVMDQNNAAVKFDRRSVTIHAGAITLHDDGRNNLVDDNGTKRGRVSCVRGWFQLDGDRAAWSERDMRVDYGSGDSLDDTLQVFANHAYTIESVTPDGLVKLRNPWGDRQPKPLTLSQFRALFESISMGPVHQEGE